MTAFLRQSRKEVTRTILAGVHATAHIAAQKFRWVSVSVVFLWATLVLWAMVEVLRIAVP